MSFVAILNAPFYVRIQGIGAADVSLKPRPVLSQVVPKPGQMSPVGGKVVSKLVRKICHCIQVLIEQVRLDRVRSRIDEDMSPAVVDHAVP